MYFLGQSSTYRLKDVLRHTFAFGTKSNLNELRAYLAAHYGTTKDRVAVYHTGRTALAVAIDQLVPAETEVVVTSLTCYAVYQAVSEVGCIPVFADVNKDTMHFGPAELEATLRFHPDAKAVIVQNNLGIPCDIKAIEKICKKHKLVLIEDLAHSAGVHYKDGREAGTVGDAAVLSFGKGKSIDTISGGAVVFNGPDAPTIVQPTRRPPLSDRLRDRWYPFFGLVIRGFYHLGNFGRLFTSLLLKLHFIQRSADAELEPLDRITYWQAKLALLKLKRLPRSGRKPLRDFYYVSKRERVLKELEGAGFVFDDIWYTCPVAPVRYYRRLNFPEEECPMAVWAADHLINFPNWYDKKALKPALKIIDKYLINKEDIIMEPDEPEEEEITEMEEETEEVATGPVEKPSKSRKSVEKSSKSGNSAEKPQKKRVKAVEAAIDEIEINTPEEHLEVVRQDDELGGTINYSELVRDKFDHTHLNRTNIIDKNINSDGTTVTLNKNERGPKKVPLKNNLPKIRQYQKPKKGPETTEGKVW